MYRSFLILGLLWACGGTNTNSGADATQDPDAGFADAQPDGGPSDLGSPDLGAPDMGSPDLGTPDMGSPDLGVPDLGTADLGTADSGVADSGVVAPMTITSPDITHGGVIPEIHTCGGADIQPQLDFANIPPGTQSLAVILIDDTINFGHWVAIDIPPGTTQLPRRASDDGQLPPGTREIPAYGRQYRGPCPGTTHTYTFRLYALSVPMTTHNWPNRISMSTLNAAFGANTLAEARLTATYTP